MTAQYYANGLSCVCVSRVRVQPSPAPWGRRSEGTLFCLWIMCVMDKSQSLPNTALGSKHLSDFLDCIQNSQRGQCFPASHSFDPRKDNVLALCLEAMGENHYICRPAVHWTQRQTRDAESGGSGSLSPVPWRGSLSLATREAPPCPEPRASVPRGLSLCSRVFHPRRPPRTGQSACALG